MEKSPRIVEFHAGDYPGFAETGFYFQLTLGRELMRVEHFHRFNEFICVVSGECGVIVNGTPGRMKAGDLLFMRPGDSHTFTDQSPGTNVVALSLLPERFDIFAEAYDCQSVGTVKRRLTPAGLERVYDAAKRCAALDDGLTGRFSGDRLRMIRVMTGMLVSLLVLPEEGPELPERFRDVLERMNEPENFREGVQAFLRLSNFSHPQLCRLTKKWLGVTPSEYVVSLRLKYAHGLVTGSDMSIESIASVVGFSSYSHFSKIFSGRFGMSPGEARKNASRIV